MQIGTHKVTASIVDNLSILRDEGVVFREIFWAELVQILVFPSPTGYIL